MVNSESIYLQFANNQQLSQWQKNIFKNINELKDLQSLILEVSSLQHKSKITQKPDLFNIRLRINEINWNHLKDNGDIFMKIQLHNLNLKVIESEDSIDTSFDIANIRVVDEVFIYKNNAYQHLLLANQFSLVILKTR